MPLRASAPFTASALPKTCSSANPTPNSNSEVINNAPTKLSADRRSICITVLSHTLKLMQMWHFAASFLARLWYHMAMDEKGLGKRLQLARQSAGLTQQALCHKAELSYSTLTKIERGAIKAPSIFTIQNIA